MRTFLIKLSILAVALLAFAAVSTFAGTSFSQCPATGNDTTGCEFLITVTAVNGSGAATAFSVAVSSPDYGPFDGSDDTLVGIQNASGATLNSITLTGAGGLDIFGFDGDGACSGGYTPQVAASACWGGAYSTASDYTSYFPNGVTASGINAADTSGTINFLSGVANGSSNWFSLEEALTVSSLTGGTPEPASFLLLATGLLGLGLFVRRSL
jgi:PEP-CTERM motif